MREFLLRGFRHVPLSAGVRSARIIVDGATRTRGRPRTNMD